jgi:hypothetical protein
MKAEKMETWISVQYLYEVRIQIEELVVLEADKVVRAVRLAADEAQSALPLQIRLRLHENTRVSEMCMPSMRGRMRSRKGHLQARYVDGIDAIHAEAQRDPDDERAPDLRRDAWDGDRQKVGRVLGVGAGGRRVVERVCAEGGDGVGVHDAVVRHVQHDAVRAASISGRYEHIAEEYKGNEEEKEARGTKTGRKDNDTQNKERYRRGKEIEREREKRGIPVVANEHLEDPRHQRRAHALAALVVEPRGQPDDVVDGIGTQE